MIDRNPTDPDLSTSGAATGSQTYELSKIHKHAQPAHNERNSRRSNSHGRHQSTSPDKASLATRLITPISRVATKIRALAYVTLLAFDIIGLLILASALSNFSTKKKTTAQTDGPESTNDEQESKRSQAYKKLREIFWPTSIWIPSACVIAIVSFTLKAVQRRHASVFENSIVYRLICPEDARKAQTGALVRLLAATVITMGIIGHLGSLSGSTSWGRELIRALQVVIVPLASVFKLTAAVFY